MIMFADATSSEIDNVMQNAWKAFGIYKKYSLAQRAYFMRTIAAQIEFLGDALIDIAGRETNLPVERLLNERSRTVFQLNSYAEACEMGNWIEACIDTAVTNITPSKPDIRKMLVPLGPVVVFGAANFPFAYSTAGGDTACAFAAGCPVIVKAHPAHPQTSEMVAGAIHKAVAACSLPEGLFAHVCGTSFNVGKQLVEHPCTRAVGFTGSFAGGKQLFDWANQRTNPIPVFAEMSSINPVFLLPQKLKLSAVEIAKQYAASITLNAGQFCTNPGLIIGVDSVDFKLFIETLADEINAIRPATMLNDGIHKNYIEKRKQALAQQGVWAMTVPKLPIAKDEGQPTVAITTADEFINNPVLHAEVFGPYSLLVKCKDMPQMREVVLSLNGQLTATLIATDEDIKDNSKLIEDIQNICGRFILNGVPTGVEVCLSMQHGGPFPATTDSRFTAVGADGIKRFARPVAYQNWPNELLADALKNENPLGIWRTVNDRLSKDAI